MRDQDEVAQCYLISVCIYAAVGTFLQRLAPGQVVPNAVWACQTLLIACCLFGLVETRFETMEESSDEAGNSILTTNSPSGYNVFTLLRIVDWLRIAPGVVYKLVTNSREDNFAYLTPSIMRYFGCKYAGTVLVQNRLPKKRCIVLMNHTVSKSDVFELFLHLEPRSTRPFSVVVRANNENSFYRSVVLQPKADKKVSEVDFLQRALNMLQSAEDMILFYYPRHRRRKTFATSAFLLAFAANCPIVQTYSYGDLSSQFRSNHLGLMRLTAAPTSKWPPPLDRSLLSMEDYMSQYRKSASAFAEYCQNWYTKQDARLDSFIQQNESAGHQWHRSFVPETFGLDGAITVNTKSKLSYLATLPRVYV